VITSTEDIDKKEPPQMGLSHCFGSVSIIYYNNLPVYQINFMYPANAFIYCVCGREKIFGARF